MAVSESDEAPGAHSEHALKFLTANTGGLTINKDSGHPSLVRNCSFWLAGFAVVRYPVLWLNVVHVG